MLPPCCQNGHLIECNAMKSKKHSNSQGVQYPLAVPLASVIGASGCLGHVRTTAKGFVAYDAGDRAIGTYFDAMAAVQAVLTAKST
jgi:hypothetical protein